MHPTHDANRQLLKKTRFRQLESRFRQLESPSRQPEGLFRQLDSLFRILPGVVCTLTRHARWRSATPPSPCVLLLLTIGEKVNVYHSATRSLRRSSSCKKKGSNGNAAERCVLPLLWATPPHGLLPPPIARETALAGRKRTFAAGEGRTSPRAQATAGPTLAPLVQCRSSARLRLPVGGHPRAKPYSSPTRAVSL